LAENLLDPRIKLRHVACFVEVARQHSVVRAAEALGMTQPGVSKTIKELEDALGLALFDRSRRSLSLTGFGEIFLTHAGLSIAALRQGVEALNQVRSSGATVFIGALPTVSSNLVPRAIERFGTSPMFCRIRVVTGPSTYLLAQLRVGDVDFVVGRMASPDGMTGFSFEHLYSERIVLAVRAGHPLLGARPFDLRQVERYPVLMPPPGAIIRPAVQRFLLSHGVGKLRDEVETVSNSLGRAIVMATDAVWIISEGVVAGDVADGRLAALPVDTSDTVGPIGITTRTGMALTPHAEALIRVIRELGEAHAKPAAIPFALAEG
jgi:LysR family transcriptional regulator, pca operon transcriptional activator